MYVTLNSEGEPNHANFSNSFSDTVMIKPNSYIALASLGLTKDDTDIGVGQIEAFDFRILYGGFDCSKNYTVPAGNYTAESLCDTMNAAILNTNLVWECRFTAKEVEDVGEAIVVEWRRAEDFRDINRYARNFLSGAQREAQLWPVQTLEPVVQKAGGVNWQSLRWKAASATNWNYTLAAVAPVGSTATPNANYKQTANQLNAGCYDVNRDQGSIQFTLAAPDVRDTSFYVVPNNYSNDPATGYVTEDVDPATNFLLALNFNGNTVQIQARKRDDTVVTVNAAFFVWPGAMFNVDCVGDPNAATATNAFALRLTVKSMLFGTVGWLPLDPINTNAINSDSIVAFQDTLDWLRSEPDEYSYQLSTMGGSVTGAALGAGTGLNNLPVSQVLDEVQYRSNTSQQFQVGTASPMPNTHSISLRRDLNGGNSNQQILFTNPIQSKQPTMFSTAFYLTNPNAGSQTYSLCGGKLQRVKDLAVGGNWAISGGGGNGTFTAAPIGKFFDFSFDDGVNTTYWKAGNANPLVWGIWNADPSGTYPLPNVNDTGTMDANTYVMTRASGTTLTPATTPLTDTAEHGFVLQVTVGTVNCYLGNRNRATRLAQPLLNGTGTPLTWTHSTNSYYVSIVTGGDANKNWLFVTLSTGDKYWCELDSSYSELPQYAFLGSACPTDETATETAKFINADVWDWRLNQANEPQALFTIEPFQKQHNLIAQYSLGIRDDYPDTYFLGQQTVNRPFDGSTQDNGFADYAVLGQPDVRAPIGCVWKKTGGNEPSHSNAYAFTDVFTPMTRSLDNANRTTDTVVVGDATADDLNHLKVHTDSGDNVLVKGEVPSVALTEEIAYTGGSPAVAETDYTDVTTDGATVIATITGDQIQPAAAAEEQLVNVCVSNLPQRSFNGRTRTLTNSIYEVPLNNANSKVIEETTTVGFIPPQKIWHPLNNPTDIALNQLDIRVADEEMRTKQSLVGPTHVALEIKPKRDIF